MKLTPVMAPIRPIIPIQLNLIALLTVETAPPQPFVTSAMMATNLSKELAIKAAIMAFISMNIQSNVKNAIPLVNHALDLWIQTAKVANLQECISITSVS